MEKEKIIETIKNQKTQYLIEVESARNRLQKRFENLTAHQIEAEMEFIRDMESRAYAMTLLLEDITDETN